MKNKRSWLLIELPVFLLLLAIFRPFIGDIAGRPKRNDRQYRMLNARFQSIHLQNGTVTFVPRPEWIGFVYVKPEDKILKLIEGSTFELTDNRHWSRTYEVVRIDEDGVVLNYRDSGEYAFGRGSLKLMWK